LHHRHFAGLHKEGIRKRASCRQSPTLDSATRGCPTDFSARSMNGGKFQHQAEFSRGTKDA
jgi:hypothetical protein